jgi:hypothetical protein
LGFWRSLIPAPAQISVKVLIGHRGGVKRPFNGRRLTSILGQKALVNRSNFTGVSRILRTPLGLIRATLIHTKGRSHVAIRLLQVCVQKLGGSVDGLTWIARIANANLTRGWRHELRLPLSASRRRSGRILIAFYNGKCPQKQRVNVPPLGGGLIGLRVISHQFIRPGRL